MYRYSNDQNGRSVFQLIIPSPFLYTIVRVAERHTLTFISSTVTPDKFKFLKLIRTNYSPQTLQNSVCPTAKRGEKVLPGGQNGFRIHYYSRIAWEPQLARRGFAPRERTNKQVAKTWAVNYCRQERKKCFSTPRGWSMVFNGRCMNQTFCGLELQREKSFMSGCACHVVSDYINSIYRQ